MSHRRRWIVRGTWTLAAILVLIVGVATVAGWRGYGHRSTGERRARMERSPQWRDGVFANPQTILNDFGGALRAILDASKDAAPKVPIAIVTGGAALKIAPSTGLRVTWLGHSTTIIEIDGQRVLTDPVWSERVSPISWVGPKRWFPPPIALAELPSIDVVLVSHDHFDHLDYGTVMRLAQTKARFVVPLGVGAHLSYWGIPDERITELDWWQSTRTGPVELWCTPSRHASGRTPFDRDATLWASFALIGDKHRVYYSGDTGFHPALAEIGKRLGPFDLTMIEVGQYHRTWPDWHIGPEQAVRAHRMLGGRVLLPIHWGLFELALHGWTEPIERTLVAAQGAHVTIATPRPGQSVEPEALPANERWWPNVPWQTASEHPIVSSQMEGAL